MTMWQDLLHDIAAAGGERVRICKLIGWPSGVGTDAKLQAMRFGLIRKVDKSHHCLTQHGWAIVGGYGSMVARKGRTGKGNPGKTFVYLARDTVPDPVIKIVAQEVGLQIPAPDLRAFAARISQIARAQ